MPRPPASSLNPLHLPSGVASPIFRRVMSLSSSNPASRSSLAQTTTPPPPTPVQTPALPLIIPNLPFPNYMCPCSSLTPLRSAHHKHRIYLNHQGMPVLKRLVSSLTTSFWIFMLGHIELPIKAMTRLMEILLKGTQLRLPTPLITKLMTSGMERTLPWVMWIHVRALFRIGISWPKNSLWRPRNLVSLSILYCISCDSLAFCAQAAVLSRTMIWISCVRSG